jgi:hypothetical protein
VAAATSKVEDEASVTTESPPEQPAKMTEESKELGVPSEPAVEKSPEPEPVTDEAPTPNVLVPHEAPRPVALERTEDPQAVYEEVLAEQLAKGSSPQVAEARAKVARVKAERGIKRGPTPVQVDKPVPSAPTKGQPAEPEPGGAPDATEPQPPQGPVGPTEDES